MFYQDRDSTAYFGNIADTLFIATGGREIKNIFTEKETQKLIQNMDTDILELISGTIINLLKDSENNSATLWSDKIKSWMRTFWPPQKKLKTQRDSSKSVFSDTALWE